MVALALLACSDSPTGPSSVTIPDAATLLAEMTSSTIGAAESLAGSSSITTVLTSRSDPQACTYSDATGFFVCPTITTGGLTITRMYRFIDAAGHSQQKPDAQTSAFEVKSSLTGTVTETVTDPRASTSSYTINSNSDETLTQLRAENHTLNGVTTTTVQGTMQTGGTTLPIDEHLKETTSDLVLPNATKGQKWPLSGTITIEEKSNSFDPFAPTATYLTTITFSGTSKVKLTFSGPFGTSSCTVDLAAPPGTGFAGCIP
jgi:hypothetical protein